MDVNCSNVPASTDGLCGTNTPALEHHRIRSRFPRGSLTTNITQYCVLKADDVVSSWSQPSIVVLVSVSNEANAGL